MNTNRSVLRTKKAIREAFTELLGEKQSIEKITIIELTDRANIVRSTFYSHYEDIYSVAKEMQGEITEALHDALKNYRDSQTKNLALPMNNLISFFNEREKEYSVLFSSGYNEKQFLQQLKDAVSKELFEKIGMTQQEIFGNPENEARFYSNILVDMICDYLSGRSGYNLYGIRDFILKLVAKLN